MTEQQFRILNNHIGYGNPQAEVVFIGLEEGCKHITLLDNYNYRFANNNELLDLSEFHIHSPVPDMNHWFGAATSSQSTWGQYCKLLLMRDGAPFINANDKFNKLNYQLNDLGSITGNSLLLELLPLPRPNHNFWDPFLDCPNLGINEYNYYACELLDDRIRRIRDLLVARDRTVILHGKSKHQDALTLFNRILDPLVFVTDHALDGPIVASEFSLTSNANVRFLLTPFFGNGAMSNAAYENLSHLM